MQPFQQRVIDEKKELDERLAKLSLFINKGDQYSKLPVRERTLLVRQESAMETYSRILQQRIENFKAEELNER